MIFLLIFFLSWLSGLFVIFLIAFGIYDSFSVIDITSFTMISFVGCLIMIPLYFLVLNWLKKKINAEKQKFYFPLTLIFLVNLPVYFIIWLNTNDLYGKSEAFLFYLGFFTTAIMFGVLWAWKIKAIKN
jgi:hypothetical protein